MGSKGAEIQITNELRLPVTKLTIRPIVTTRRKPMNEYQLNETE